MTQLERRLLLGGITSGWASLAAAQPGPSGSDGHDAGHDVAAAAEFMPLIPRRSGDPVTFTASLDKAALKATSGGWAREITARQLPLATAMAAAHLFIAPGGAREMHWHNSAEWAFILDGQCQVTVLDPEGEIEVANYGAGDLWYFPAGHAHAIHTLGDTPCHAVLAFNDGLYGEHGTFGLSDWMSRVEPGLRAQSLGVPADTFDAIPAGETYIMRGEVIPLDSPQARAEQPLGAARTHRHALLQRSPWCSAAGGSIHVATARDFPLSAAMTGVLTRLDPGAMHAHHWHPNANEFLYVAKGTVEVTLFATDKRMAVARLSAGECAFIPINCGHSVRNTGSAAAETVAALDSGAYQEGSLSDWLAKAPSHLLANNLGLSEAAIARLRRDKVVIAA